ncbi:hypothetical protein [Acidisarcina polymorpha]|uniref:hypothetical protein n=1 Tax=Acidisarcina polymorpha TaxID=2211140 RepID=UPI001F3C0C19|nr:hypothetical protein [Acidisarcina polymorpha]
MDTPSEFATLCSGGKAATKPPWKTLCVSHFASARLRLGFSEKQSVFKPLVERRQLSYINCKSACKSGTNRTTQAEISNLLRLSSRGGSSLALFIGFQSH